MKIHCCERNFFATSSSLASVQLPSPRETHLWYILPDEVKSASLLNQYLELLSSCEKENVLRMQGDQLKKRALLARALVRTTIARYQINSQFSPRTLKFRKNIHGKPEVDWQQNNDFTPPVLHFNISHTSSLIACGVTLDSPIGIDVEEKHRRTKSNMISFARRYFSPQEVDLLASISDPEIQRCEFLKLWTLKESYVKALGRGFYAAPFKSFTIRYRAATEGGLHLSGNCSSEASEIIVESFDETKNLTSNWHFSLLELAHTHYAAVCVEKDNNIGAIVGEEGPRMKLTAWKTIPFVEDECVTGTDAIATLSCLS